MGVLYFSPVFFWIFRLPVYLAFDKCPGMDADFEPGAAFERPKGKNIMHFFMPNALVLSILLPLSCVSADVPADSPAGDQKAVLITGATTGIGRATAEHLAAAGYFVYAGARKDADMQELNRIDNIMAVRIDVTRQDQIDEAARLIKEQGRGLWGLVNNAGVGIFAPLIEAKEADLEYLFDVNVFGVFRVTQAFAPMIIESKGRIVNISSISGVLSVGTAGMYAGSKHALEAMTDALAEELRDFGVHVSAVNPGSFASEIGLTRCKRFLQDKGDDWGLFEERRQEMLRICEDKVESGPANAGTPPDAVALAIERALFEEHPRDRYLVVSEQIEAGDTIAQAISEMLALNLGHEHSYTRDEIVWFIDALWPYMDGQKTWAGPEEKWKFIDAWSERRVPEKD
jgi:NAD(P)-dependent dehydrogenase (short-subunit alcohol dehydrogenase family)